MSDDEYDIEESFGEALELNSAIVMKTRTMVRELHILRNGHLALAQKYDEIADALTAACHDSAERLGDALVAELGAMSFTAEDDDHDDGVEVE